MEKIGILYDILFCTRKILYWKIYICVIKAYRTDFPPVESGKCSCQKMTHKLYGVCMCVYVVYAQEMRWNLWGVDASLLL